MVLPGPSSSPAVFPVSSYTHKCWLSRRWLLLWVAACSSNRQAGSTSSTGRTSSGCRQASPCLLQGPWPWSPSFAQHEQVGLLPGWGESGRRFHAHLGRANRGGQTRPRCYNPHPCKAGGDVCQQTLPTPLHWKARYQDCTLPTQRNSVGHSLCLPPPTCWLKKHEGLETLGCFYLHSVSGDVSHISTAFRVRGGWAEGQDLASILWRRGLRCTLKSYETSDQCPHPLHPHPQGTLQ